MKVIWSGYGLSKDGSRKMLNSDLLRIGAQATNIQTHTVRQTILIVQDISVLAGHQYYITFSMLAYGEKDCIFFQSMGLIHRIQYIIVSIDSMSYVFLIFCNYIAIVSPITL